VSNSNAGHNPNFQVAKGSVGGTASIWLTADGYWGADWWDEHYGYNNWPGMYTMTMGGNSFSSLGEYEITIQSNPEEESAASRIIPNVWSPALSHLKTKPAFVRTVGRKKAPRI